MNYVVRSKDRFESVGHEGVAESIAAKKINRNRAYGVRTAQVLASVGLLSFLGGFRHSEGGLDQKIAGGIVAVFDDATSPAKNGNGNYDIPFINIMGKKIEITNNSTNLPLTVTTDECDYVPTVILANDDPLKLLGRAAGTNILSVEEDLYNRMGAANQASISSALSDPNSIGQEISVPLC